MNTMPPRADYGIDAPGVVRNLAAIGGVLLVVAGAMAIWSPPLLWGSLCPGLSMIAAAGVMVWGSKVGKLRLRERVLDGLALRGDECVLDVGCGRGLMLLGAAKRLTTGKAVGIDLWQKQDQSGNDPKATRANAEREGVAERIDLHDGDARQLPFPDGSFDVVVSSWAIHNIYDKAGREKAVEEMVRVLKGCGRLALVDIQRTAEYAAALTKAGLAEVRVSPPHFLFVIPTRVVTAVKK
jgi:SAM-dependent methyltransferase